MELSTAGPIRMINNIILTRPGLFLPNLLGMNDRMNSSVRTAVIRYLLSSEERAAEILHGMAQLVARISFGLLCDEVLLA
jgi:hypothetical protein